MSSLPGQIVYFGDSLSDDGNLFAYGQQVLDPAIVDAISGPTGAVSDGPTHATYTAAQTGVTVQNYAVAAAEVDGVQTLGDLIASSGLAGFLTVPPTDPILATDINLAGQVDRFVADNTGADLGNTSAFIWIGGNDFGAIDFSAGDPGAVIADKLAAIVSGIATQAVTLASAGVGDIKIATMPSASFFALSATFTESDSALAEAVLTTHNFTLGEMVDILQRVGINAELFDIRAVTDAIVDDPTGFGLIAPYGQTQLGSTVLDSYDADQVAFYDDIHPSTATQGVIGAFNAVAFAGAHVFSGADYGDHYEFGDAANYATGLAGDDWLRGKGGKDVLIGGTGDDDLAGQRGSDLLSGGQDNDILRGCYGADILGGGWGDDVIKGGGGDDVIIGGLGSDDMKGARGDDTFIFTEATLIGGSNGIDTDLIDGGDGTDRLIMVLDDASYAAWAAALEGSSPQAALDAFGITATSVESVVAVNGRDGLSAFSAETWFADADLWGLI